jgi:hypothetical protein
VTAKQSIDPHKLGETIAAFAALPDFLGEIADRLKRWLLA